MSNVIFPTYFYIVDKRGKTNCFTPNPHNSVTDNSHINIYLVDLPASMLIDILQI